MIYTMDAVYKYALTSFMIWGVLFGGMCWSQANLMEGKRIGLYISSSGFELADGYFIPTAQFLSVEDDRSSIGELKAELMIRLGELLSEQLSMLSNADTVYFLNADVYKGRYFQQFYSTATNRLTDSLRLENTDLLVVINSLVLNIRKHRSVYIRSNQMVTERIPIKVADMSISLLDPYVPDLAIEAKTCYDEQKDKKVSYEFDFYRENSKLGTFFSQLFSQWWYQLTEGELDNCETTTE